MRLLLRLTLENGPTPARVVGEASSGEEALARWRELRPDIVILDTHLLGMSGLDVAARILAEDPNQCIVVCSADTGTRRESTPAGVRAHVSKMEIWRLPGLIRTLHGSTDG